jgi:hypothetical protein
MLVDAAKRDPAALNGDFFSLDYLRDRVHDDFSEAELARLNTDLEELNGAVGDEDFAATADAAQQLRTTLAGVKP